MGQLLEKDINNGFNYFINKTLFFMEKIDLIKEDIETWFREGIILNKLQLERLVNRVDKKCIKYIKKSNKRYMLAKMALENEEGLEEKYKYYNNYLNTLLQVLLDISEDENRNELLNRDVDYFMKGIMEKVEKSSFREESF